MNSKKFAFLFPGQGAQYVGMGKDFYESFLIARQTFEEADDILSQKLSKLIFEGAASELTLTKHSQVAIYVVSMAVLRTVQHQMPDIAPVVCAGLSLGEYSALTAAQKLTFAQTLPLVQARAQYMHDACQSAPGTMQVVLGLGEVEVAKILADINPPHAVWVANLNCPGQVVIAGSHSGIIAAAEALKSSGAKRVLPLEVSGAFHSGLMREAQARLEPKIAVASFSDSKVDLVMNIPGGYVTDLKEVRANLIAQVTQPVRWEQGIRAMMGRGIEIYLEMGCGKTLAGMNKRIGVAMPTISVEKVADLDELQKFSETGFTYATIEK